MPFVHSGAAMTDYNTQGFSYFWEPGKAFCLGEQMKKKSGLSSGGKDCCKPNLVAKRGPSVVNRPSESLARLRGASPCFVQEKMGKDEITSVTSSGWQVLKMGKLIIADVAVM